VRDWTDDLIAGIHDAVEDEEEEKGLPYQWSDEVYVTVWAHLDIVCRPAETRPVITPLRKVV
jgi:histidinol phosphatase-like PHP family hydrolase